jgi:shikimate kinase
MPRPAVGSSPRRIVLVGFMGCGKTTVGRKLARALGWQFRDLDEWIEERLGLAIAEVFDRHGEAFFRAEELNVARLASQLDDCVVAAGGGAFAQPETREVLRSGAVTVWLRGELEVLARRIPDDGSRPLARNRERMRDLYSSREPSYQMADMVVDTATGPASAVARRIMGMIRPRRRPATHGTQGG